MIGFLLGVVVGIGACVAGVVWLAYQPPSKWWPK